MEFNPNNAVIQLCMQGMAMQEKGEYEKAGQLFLQAWDESLNDFEKFISAYYIANHKRDITEKSKWLETAIQLAVSLNNITSNGALPFLYNSVAECYENIGDDVKAAHYVQLAKSSVTTPADAGPFYHGTKADLKTDDHLTAGYLSNYKDDLVMNHIYFTAVASGAALAAELAKGDAPARVYIIEPTGNFENDPNVTNQRFPGNPTRSYRTTLPLKVIGELKEWTRLTPDELKRWKERLAGNTGEVIN